MSSLRYKLAGICLAFILSIASVNATPTFPALDGRRVIDEAGLLAVSTRKSISELSAQHQSATGNQVVLVTLTDLQGYSIEEFGYQLGRHWGIGEKGKNNGVIILLAKAERKIRIEVGYGLEGNLTDAISANIINTVALPAFKRGKFDEGLQATVAATIAALGGEYQATTRDRSSGKPGSNLLVIGLIILFIILRLTLGNVTSGSRYHRGRHHRGGFGGGFGGSGGGFGGGFGGGGGSFGGGGASGGW